MMNNEVFEARLKELFYRRKDLYPARLFEAMEYALFSGGKRIRPALSFLSAEFADADINAASVFAVAVECIHTYSLIHDDLPCMDNDDVRRGKPTCHRMFGEAIALLAGDALLNLAYEILFEEAEKNPDLIKGAGLIAKCASGEGMIGGQAMEFSAELFNEAEITELCMKKTGALIYCSIIAPCLNGVSPEKFSALSSYATAVGLAFQLADDLIDIDKKESKSFLGVMGEGYTRNMLSRLNATAKRALEKFPEGDELLKFSEYLTNRTR